MINMEDTDTGKQSQGDTQYHDQRQGDSNIGKVAADQRADEGRDKQQLMIDRRVAGHVCVGYIVGAFGEQAEQANRGRSP